MPQFKFIGETFTAESTRQEAHAWYYELLCDSDKFLLSGDYSAATDNIKLEAIRVVGQEIEDNLHFQVEHEPNESVK